MTKKDFIALAEWVRPLKGSAAELTLIQEEKLAAFCKTQSPRFDRDRWLTYINR